MTNKPTQTEVDAAFTAAAQYWGRTWKGDLYAAWAKAHYPASLDASVLQRIRNTYGPSYLGRYVRR
jgi:hypothetical protein